MILKNTFGHRPPMSTEQAQRYLQTTLQWLCDYYPSEDFYQRGLKIKNRWRFSWYDSLIVTAALEYGCHTLYSEDLQHQPIYLLVFLSI